MNILILSYEFPPLGGGGAKVVFALSKELRRMGHQVDVLTMGYGRMFGYEVVDGVNVYRVPGIRIRKSVCSFVEMIPYVLIATCLALRLIRKNRYDLNHTHFIYPDGCISWILMKLTNLPYVITAHGSDVPRYNPNRFRLLHVFLYPVWKLIVKNAAHISCPSYFLRSLIQRKYPELNVSIIPNGFDIDRFHVDKKRKKSILVVSRMFKRKGVQYFLRALQGVKHDFEVNIIGNGPYLPVLKALARKWNIEAVFHGFIDNGAKEFATFFETSRIFVFTSEVENFPIVLLEAMAAGLAIITTKETGCAEVVGNTAILVEPKNPYDLRVSLINLMNDPEMCQSLGELARRRLEENFSWHVIALQYLHMYMGHHAPVQAQLPHL